MGLSIAQADALRRERAALEAQRRRIQAEAEEMGEAMTSRDGLGISWDIYRI